MLDFAKYGYAGLFLASFLSATVLPFSSEAVFSAMVFGGLDARTCVALATLGNWLGGLTCYGLGYLGKIEWIEKWLHIGHDKNRATKKMVQKIRRMDSISVVFAVYRRHFGCYGRIHAMPLLEFGHTDARRQIFALCSMDVHQSSVALSATKKIHLSLWNKICRFVN